MRRVVITGMGAVTPLGNHVEATWEGLISLRSGIGPVTRIDPSGLSVRIAGEVKGFDPEDYVSKKDILRLDPFVHYAAAAAAMALQDAGLMTEQPALSIQRSADGAEAEQKHTPNIGHLKEAGVIMGSSRGGISGMERALEGNILRGRPFSAYLMSSSTINMAAAALSMKFGIKGPALGISTACASGTNAIGEAFRMIQSGRIDLALCGGTDAPVCRLALGGYGASGSLSRRNDEPEKASRPFDRDRDGFVISEGAGVLVIEELEHALQRGVNIYVELAGYGTSSDALHQTRPDSAGEAKAIKKALDDAAVSIEDVDYINAHGTSTPLGDAAEIEAIQKVFGSHSGTIPVTSCKSMLGHMLGAAGAVEAAITALSIKRGIITPTANLDFPDSRFTADFVIAKTRKDINVAVTNSFGFGGVNAVLVLRKFQI